MGVISQDGELLGSGGGGGGDVLAWDSGDLTALTHDFTSTATLDVEGVTLTARNAGSATELALGANGLSVEASAATNFNTTTDTAVGVDIDLADAGVKPGDDWVIEWTMGTWAGETTGGYKYGLFGFRNVGAGASVNGVMVLLGYESSAKQAGVKAIEEGSNAVDVQQDDALWAAGKTRVRMSYRGGAVQCWAGDGTTWSRIGEAFDAGGVRECGGVPTPFAGLMAGTFNTFKVRVTRIKIWKRAQPSG